jgi:hypothetical protein
MKNIMMKKVVASGLALTLIFGGGTAAFANGKGNNKNDDHEDTGNSKQYVKVQNKTDIRISFDDVKGNDVEWAMRYIASLASKRVFEGYEDGSFKPRNAISRIEAITAAVRLMGLRDKAESAAEMATQLNFKDADKIPAWAVGYVAVALENDLFNENDNSVQPQKVADRLWATTLLVKALKLETEAKAKMNTNLTFKDAKEIPAGSVGYVAVAVEKGLIEGFENNTFRPNAPVTRAQLAKLLDVTGDQIGDKDTVTGTVSAAVYNNVLTLNKGGVPTTLVLDANAFIFRNGAKVAASALQVGDQLKVRSYNNVVIFVEVVNPVVVTPPSVNPIGTLAGTTTNANGGIATISITQTINGVTQTTIYNVNPNVQISGDLSMFVQGHLIELVSTNQLVTTIVIK